MTRAKADSDPWLTDMVSRDREIAKTVVYGIRTIISLLREIRDGQAEEVRSLMRENARLRDDLLAAYRAQLPTQPPVHDSRNDIPACETRGCALPRGHWEAHRGSIKALR